MAGLVAVETTVEARKGEGGSEEKRQVLVKKWAYPI